MDEVTIRELRDRSGEILGPVARGETLIVTRSGVPVGELRPVPKPRVSAATLLARWRTVPQVDTDAFRADIDVLLDQSL